MQSAGLAVDPGSVDDVSWLIYESSDAPVAGPRAAAAVADAGGESGRTGGLVDGDGR